MTIYLSRESVDAPGEQVDLSKTHQHQIFSRLIAIFFQLTVVVSLLDGQGVQRVAGVVTGLDGTLIPSASVSAIAALSNSKYSSLAPILGAVAATTISASDGSFVLTGIPSGQYRLCVQAPLTAWLNPCMWSTGVDIVSVASSSISGLKVRLLKGSILRVKIIDSQKLLQAKGLQAPAAILMGIFRTNGLFFPLIETSLSQAGIDRQITIPFDSDLKFHASFGKAQATDALGQVVSANGITVPIRQSSAAKQELQMTFSLTNLLP